MNNNIQCYDYYSHDLCTLYKTYMSRSDGSRYRLSQKHWKMLKTSDKHWSVVRNMFKMASFASKKKDTVQFSSCKKR